MGDSYEKVLRVLGRPFDERTIRGKKADAPIRGVMINYYMKMGAPDLVNEFNDEYILIAFDNDNKLTEIRTNVNGLSFPASLKE